MLQDACESHVVEVALGVDGGLSEELVHVLVGEAVPHGGEQLSQGVLVDDTWGGGGGNQALCYLLLIVFE